MQYIYFETQGGQHAHVIPSDRLQLVSHAGSIVFNTASPHYQLIPTMDSVTFFSTSEQAFRQLQVHAATQAANLKRMEALANSAHDVVLDPRGGVYRREE